MTLAISPHRVGDHVKRLKCMCYLLNSGDLASLSKGFGHVT